MIYKLNSHRLPFLDRTRGLIMVFMALDHALFFWSSGRINNEGLPRLINGAVSFNPLGSSNALALIVMFLSSLCAPGFLFIAGMFWPYPLKSVQQKVFRMINARTKVSTLVRALHFSEQVSFIF